MRGKGALLPLVFFLFLSLLAANINWICCERSEPSTGTLMGGATEGEINLSSDGKYRDGLVDNFDNFISPGYPSGHIQTDGNTWSG